MLNRRGHISNFFLAEGKNVGWRKRREHSRAGLLILLPSGASHKLNFEAIIVYYAESSLSQSQRSPTFQKLNFKCI